MIKRMRKPCVPGALSPLPSPRLETRLSVSVSEPICRFITVLHIISSLPGADDVWFSLNGTTYQNNSIVILEDIGTGADALICVTNLTACCRHPYTNGMEQKALGNWYFPNGTRVLSSGIQWDFYRTRGHMKVLLQRRRGGAEGVYRCAIPDTFGFIQTIYIGVYSANTGE